MEGLLNETRTIEEGKAKILAKLVLEEKVNAAIQLLDDDTSSGVLLLSTDMIKTLHQKYPNAKPSNDTMMLHRLISHINELIIFDGVNADFVRKCVIKNKGLHGPSGLDADFWSKILCNSTYGYGSDDLCHAIALLAQMLCPEELVDPKSIEGLVAFQLIP